ncbi:MAG: DUF4342 domain-containing protein [Chitinophagaceae bacterium]|nr:DUF4342 domain-containing protein [Chitinophagaceae bacterium]MCB9045146.1 DUF4342 domain-containing protein [Chitinophagales bacterium]
MSMKETFEVHGEQLVKKIKELIAEGNVRKVTIKDHEGKELMSFPLTIGVVGALLAPILAAVGALAALVGDCTIAVEREEE